MKEDHPFAPKTSLLSQESYNAQEFLNPKSNPNLYEKRGIYST